MKPYNILSFFVIFLLLIPSQIFAQYQERKDAARSINVPFSDISSLRRIPFNSDWRFMLVTETNKDTDYASPALDDSSWRKVNLPHDFQFELPWIENGSKARGFKPMAEGWYRKTFYADSLWKGREVSLDFGGIIYYGDVYLNGHKIASTDYGYVGLEADLSKHIRYGDKNVVAVYSSTGTTKGSRWYTGGGLFRDVYLSVKNPTGIARHGVFIHSDVEDNYASVNISVEVKNYKNNNVKAIASVFTPDGQKISTVSTDMPVNDKHQTVEVALPVVKIEKPSLWSPDTPYLYTAQVKIISGNETVDSVCESFGIRKLEFSPEFGFKLNGKKLFVKGHSGHHDMGALGAAAYDAGIERMMLKLKEFGFNAIRCSHNPYSENFTKIADKVGMLVVDELIDKWSDNDYWAGRRPFTEIWYQLIPEWIKRDRNSPSVIMWSLGNELQIREDWAGFNGLNDYGVTTYKIFDTLVKRFDPTRKTTVAMFPARAGGISRKDASWMTHLDPPELACATEIASFNYQSAMYDEYVKRAPHLIIFQSEAETSALLEPFYNMDQDKSVGISYWGAIEYWGESNSWPKKGWNYSFFDHTVNPYPQAWLIKSAFMPDEPTVRIGVIQPETSETINWNDINVGKEDIKDHWNYPENSKLNLVTYTNAPAVELFINGKSQGIKKNDSTNKSTRNIIKWNDINYGKGGNIHAVALDKDGNIIARHSMQTAGKPAKLEISCNKTTLDANGKDLLYLDVTAVDSKGNRVPYYDEELKVEVEGEGLLLALDDADHYTDLLFEGVNSKNMRNGRMQVIVRSTENPGKITVNLKTPKFKKTFNCISQN